MAEGTCSACEAEGFVQFNGVCRKCNNKPGRVVLGILGLPLILAVFGAIVWLVNTYGDAVLDAMGTLAVVIIVILVILVPFVIAALLFKAAK
ncbi:hypothetical protein [Rhodococcus sp. IEGM 1379]|uniref:hypothetical protein n=1 Tax=Rhodococcus sp. IEGM 1379 TaxID=3047086 RepID=UPI0024B69B06|nr:hypothetical protein [Rhodococcus sp. IEGM 1379]MDI9915504.1 hypothetical protein [Rhodococcus sp. IEGM 1379]